jgi:LysM repeat protein
MILSLSLIFSSACSGVSEEDIEKLKLENLSLEVELEQEKRQAEILNRALTNAYKERDRLVDRLHATAAAPGEETAQTADGTPAEGQAAQPDPSRIYVVKAGDTLSSIAQQNGTTLAAILTLNPYLAGRNDYVVWENDRINLPR